MPQIQLFTELKKNPTHLHLLLRMAPKHRLDHRPKISIFPVTGLDIEANLGSASFVIEADLLILKPISTVLKPI